jgi:hypothetical protein
MGCVLCLSGGCGGHSGEDPAPAPTNWVLDGTYTATDGSVKATFSPQTNEYTLSYLSCAAGAACQLHGTFDLPPPYETLTLTDPASGQTFTWDVKLKTSMLQGTPEQQNVRPLEGYGLYHSPGSDGTNGRLLDPGAAIPGLYVKMTPGPGMTGATFRCLIHSVTQNGVGVFVPTDSC